MVGHYSRGLSDDGALLTHRCTVNMAVAMGLLRQRLCNVTQHWGLRDSHGLLVKGHRVHGYVTNGFGNSREHVINRLDDGGVRDGGVRDDAGLRSDGCVLGLWRGGRFVLEGNVGGEDGRRRRKNGAAWLGRRRLTSQGRGAGRGRGATFCVLFEVFFAFCRKTKRSIEDTEEEEEEEIRLAIRLERMKCRHAVILDVHSSSGGF